MNQKNYYNIFYTNSSKLSHNIHQISTTFQSSSFFADRTKSFLNTGQTIGSAVNCRTYELFKQLSLLIYKQKYSIYNKIGKIEKQNWPNNNKPLRILYADSESQLIIKFLGDCLDD